MARSRGEMNTSVNTVSYSDYPVQPVGIYGWRKRCLYGFILFLMVITVFNLALLVWILRVLNFSVDGMGNMKITDDGIVLDGEAEFIDSLYVSKLESLQDQPLFVESSEGIIMHARNKENQVTNTLAMINSTLEAQCEIFQVKDKEGRTRFRVTEDAVEMDIPEVHYTGDTKVVFEGSVSTPSVMSPPSESLQIRSESTAIHIHGNTGVNIEAPMGDVLLKSSDEIVLHSTDNSIVLSSKDLYLKDIQLSVPQTSQLYTGEVYQLCMCKNGRLFLSEPNGECLASMVVCK